MDERALLHHVASRAADYLESLAERPVHERSSLDELRAILDGDLPAGPTDPVAVVDALADAGDAGAIAMGGGRYFGFVIGGALPATVAADWLTSTWDQNAGLYVGGPAAAVVEEVAGRWLIDLLGLPQGVSFAFVTGCHMAHVTALAAARHEVLTRTGIDVSRSGLHGAPRIRIVVGEERHITIDRALRLLGIGSEQIETVASDEQGRMDARALADALDGSTDPTIVCAQVGNVNTGAVDPLPAIADAAASAGAWLHVDGAFGMWAAASSRLRRLVAGIDRADSWATDAHKWLNVPYDSGLAFCAHPDAHRAAMAVHASYLEHADETGPRDQMDWTPEFSRRARGFAVYAALRSLGRSGVTDLIERCCAHARLFADLLGKTDGVEILNDVVLNQVLVRFGDDDEMTRKVVHAVQEDGTCWLGGTVWHGRAAMRISVSNWRTTESDVRRSVDAIARAVTRVADRAASATEHSSAGAPSAARSHATRR